MRQRVPLRALTIPTLLLGLVFIPGHVSAQSAGKLITGQILQGSVGFEGSTMYTFDANDPGILTVVARSLDGSDLVLVVTDYAGQPLPDGRSDQDLGGDPGAEQFAVTIPRQGPYRILVESFSGGQASYKVGVSWIPFPDVEQAPDPDGNPTSAIPLQAGQGPHMDEINGAAGDYWDWYVFRAESSGTLTVATRTEEGDLILEAFEEGSYTEPMNRSDQDLQGSAGNEAVTVVVEAGQAFFFKVSAWSEGAYIPYQIQAGLIGN
jgi:hypothetical protein